MGHRPVIAICTKLTQARWSVWDRPAALVPLNYITAVQSAGLRGLNEGQKVTYEVAMERGKASATNLRVA